MQYFFLRMVRIRLRMGNLRVGNELKWQAGVLALLVFEQILQGLFFQVIILLGLWHFFQFRSAPTSFHLSLENTFHIAR